MDLIDAAASPFCRKVRALMHEAGRMGDVRLVASSGHPTAPNRTAGAVNPLGKIPCLLRDDGPALYDSRVICRYLDALWGARLYPHRRLWDVLTLEATADGIMEAAVLIVYEGRSRPEEKRHEPWVEGQWAKVEAALSAIEARWMSHLAGPVDMGQIAVGCALGYLDFRHGGRDWRGAHPALGRWYAGFAERPAMRATAPT